MVTADVLKGRVTVVNCCLFLILKVFINNTVQNPLHRDFGVGGDVLVRQKMINRP
jgi:hypothetical protein